MSICPHCGSDAVKHDHTEGNAVPKVGDVSICPGCMCLSVYVAGPIGLFRRRTTVQENAEFMADHRVRDALVALAAHRNSYAAVAALRRTARDGDNNGGGQPGGFT